jgi:hypothetical protein
MRAAWRSFPEPKRDLAGLDRWQNREVDMQGQTTKACVGRWGFGLGWLLLTLLAGGPLARAQGYIYNQMQVPGNEAIAVADFNGDGIPDIVTIVNAGSFSVSLGKRDGTFAPPVVVDAAFAPSALVIGDFNGVGKLDIAATSIFSNPPLRVYLGNGDGTFQAPVTYSTGNGPVGIVTADFNGDQKLDIAVLNQADSTVSVYFGNGDGTFQAQSVQPATASASVILTADVNHDGRADIITFYNGPGLNLSVLLGNADATFTQVNTNWAVQQLGPAAAVGDLNGDGIPDLVIPHYEGNPSGFLLLIGNGDGTFQFPTLVPILFT